MILRGVVLRIGQKYNFSRTLTTDWKGVIGLEVHLQIASESKLFSHAPVSAGPVNGRVALFDAAIPGTLPVLNRRCLEAAVQTAVALNCEEINRITRFDRKHYFYADMPAGFQITQHFHPIARYGSLAFYTQKSQKLEPKAQSCRITQIQLEQDSGKSIHDADFNMSLIDLNRAGIGLLEIVFEPELSCGEEAASLVKELVAVVRALGVCSGRLEEGAVRVDANVSVHKPGTPLGTRTEIKNMNSMRSIKHAIDYEISRQIRCLQTGGSIVNVTMAYDTETDTTVPMRDKEVVQDYRFFPEPNIPMVDLDQVGICVETIKKNLPPLPAELRNQIQEKFNLSFNKAALLFREADLYNLFIDTMRVTNSKYADRAFSLLLVEVLGYLNKTSVRLSQTELTAENFSQLLAIREERKATHAKCAEILEQTMQHGNEPQKILEENNWSLLADNKLISGLCDEAISLYPKECGQVLRDKERALNKLLAHVRKATDGRADMGAVKKLLLEKIRSSQVNKEEIQIGR